MKLSGPSRQRSANLVMNVDDKLLTPVVANVLEGNFVVNEFELQSHYYVHFWYNTLGKGMKPLYLSSMG